MNKFIKLGKRILALFIVVLLNVNTYAAVGANDGSAFVTKAEFDALVNTFNEQMDSYQSGLNSKIDGAIANYLAGLSNEQRLPQDNLYKSSCNYYKKNKNYVFSKTMFTPEETRLPEAMSSTGELLWSAFVGGVERSVNIYTGGNNAGDESYGRYYYVDDYGNLDCVKSVRVRHVIGGSYRGNIGNTMTGKYLTPDTKEMTSYYGNIKVGSNTTAFNYTYGYTLEEKDGSKVEYDEMMMYPMVDDNEMYGIYDKNETKLVEAGRSAPGNPYRGLVLAQSVRGDVTVNGEFSIGVFDVDYVKRPAYEIIGNGGASYVLDQQVMAYEGCPVARASENGDMHIMVKWTNDVATQNYVQTGLKVGESGFANDGVAIIDPDLNTNLANNLIEANKEKEIIIYGLKKNDLVWIKGIPATADTSELDIADVGLVTE